MKLKIIKRNSLFGLLLLAFCLLGCKKEWLDEKADKNQATPETLQDFQAMMDNARFLMNYFAPAYREVASDGHYINESAWSGSNDHARNAYTWTHDRPYNLVREWNSAYSKIFYCNLALEGLRKITFSSAIEQENLDDCIGQALFHRAYTFNDLAQQYAPTWDSNSASIDLSIPLRITSDVTSPSVHSTVYKTYSLVINDLKMAKDLLPINPIFKSRPSRAAAYALLARVYLSMSNYDSALVYADKCLSINNSLIDYNELSITANFIGQFNPEVLFHITLYTSPLSGVLTTQCFINSSLYSLYDSNDLRKSVYFKLNSNGQISFKGNYNSSTSELFSGLAIDEMYLIRSECFARKGNKDAALSDLNTLMIKRWKNNGSWTLFSATDAEDALSKILTERKKELVLRGLRWSDLKRLNKDERFKITISRTIGGKTYILEPNSYKYSFPIPDDVIQLSGMQQNPGW